MYDEKMLARAKLYADAMAQGVDPTTGEFVPLGDSLSKLKIQKCMSYISEVLANVIKNPSGKRDRRPFVITPEQKAAVELSEQPIGVNEIARRINDVTDSSCSRNISGTTIASWLADNGYLTAVKDAEGHTKKRLNDRSFALGISEVEGVSKEGRPYKKLVYDRRAQAFILEHIEDIVNGVKSEELGVRS